MISQPSFIPGKQFKGISTNSSLSPEPSSSDNWEAPSLDPQGNYKATVENGEDEKKKKKLAKLHKMERSSLISITPSPNQLKTQEFKTKQNTLDYYSVSSPSTLL